MFGTTYLHNNKTKTHYQMPNRHMKFVMTMVSSNISLRIKILSHAKQCYVSIKMSQWPSCYQLIYHSICSIKSSTFLLMVSWYNCYTGCESMNRIKRHNKQQNRVLSYCWGGDGYTNYNCYYYYYYFFFFFYYYDHHHHKNDDGLIIASLKQNIFIDVNCLALKLNALLICKRLDFNGGYARADIFIWHFSITYTFSAKALIGCHTSKFFLKIIHVMMTHFNRVSKYMHINHTWKQIHHSVASDEGHLMDLRGLHIANLYE